MDARLAEVFSEAQMSPWMNAKIFPLRRDFTSDKAQGEDTPGVSPRELHVSSAYSQPFVDILFNQGLVWHVCFISSDFHFFNNGLRNSNGYWF